MHLNKYLIKTLLVLILATGVLAFVGCGDNKEEAETPGEENQEMIEGETADEITPEESDTLEVEEPGDMMVDLSGTWTGTLDSRATTFKVTEQNENEFKGNITIQYRNPLNKTVSGTINFDEMKITMKDVSRSRYNGTYTGTISEDRNKITGTFTLNDDGSNYSFTLTRK